MLQILNSWFRASQFNVNKNPTRCNSMQMFIYCKVTLHVSGVTAPIIRSTKNCNRNLPYRPDRTTLEGSSFSSIMTCTGGSSYSFITPDDGCCDTLNMYSDFAVNKYMHTVASGWIFINIECYKYLNGSVCVEQPFKLKQE